MSDQPPASKRDDYTRDRMQKIAHLVDEELPVGWGFFVMAFPMGNQDGRMNYVSNGSREDIVKLMQEFIDKGGFREGHHADVMPDFERVALYLKHLNRNEIPASQCISHFELVSGWQHDRVVKAFQILGQSNKTNQK